MPRNTTKVMQSTTTPTAQLCRNTIINYAASIAGNLWRRCCRRQNTNGQQGLVPDKLGQLPHQEIPTAHGAGKQKSTGNLQKRHVSQFALSYLLRMACFLFLTLVNNSDEWA